MILYGGNGPLARTVRPVLRRRPWGLPDVQALPPQAWCRICGAEVYRQDRTLCQRCRKVHGA